MRMCVDYRALNKKTVISNYPLPRVDSTLEKISDARWFSTMDIQSGYHQLAMDPEDIEKTAFQTPFGSYEFTVLPFGLTNGPPEFMRFMNSIINVSLSEFVWATYVCLVKQEKII